jgi:hypothetical protein
MKEKQKKDKKYTKKGQIELKMLTENYLDVNRNDILDDIKKMNKASFRDMFKVIGNILLPYRYPGDELEDESATDEDKVNLLVSLHTNLEPLWKELKKEMFEYKEKVLPQRSAMNALREKVKTTPSHALAEYKDIIEGQSYSIENYNSIKIPKPKILPNRLKKIVIEANFDAGKINLIRKDQDIVNNFIKYLEGFPLEVFSKCEKCGRFIIVTRKDRKCCSTNCAAGLKQKRNWEKDREACLLKEKMRYQKRKASKTH